MKKMTEEMQKPTKPIRLYLTYFTRRSFQLSKEIPKEKLKNKKMSSYNLLNQAPFAPALTPSHLSARFRPKTCLQDPSKNQNVNISDGALQTQKPFSSLQMKHRFQQLS